MLDSFPRWKVCVFKTNASLKQSRDNKACVYTTSALMDFFAIERLGIYRKRMLETIHGKACETYKPMLDVLSKRKGLCVHHTCMLETLSRLKSFTTNASATWHETNIIWLTGAW